MRASIEVVDATMDDTEIAVQNDMFERIMDVCGGHPNQRVLQVLVDTLACVGVNTTTPLHEILEAVKLSFTDALPRDRREN